MKKSGVRAIAVLIFGVFLFSSCEQSTNTGLEESFQSVKEVTAISGAQDVTMNLERRDSGDSFFTVSLDGKNEIEGWCIEWNENASFGINEETKLYSTKGHDEWKELNYFMSIKDDLRANDPDLTYREIQVVIWSLIDKPAFDVDKIDEYENISERIYKDGKPLFDVQKVKNILNQVDEYFQSNKSKTFWWWFYVIFIQNKGQTIMVDSETAFAYNGEYATCFSEFNELNNNNRWGWSNGPLSEGTYEFDIYAGAGQCDLSKGTLVGKLEVEYSNGTAQITYKMTETSGVTDKLYKMTTTHLYVGNEPLASKNGEPTVSPGQFPYKNSHDSVSEYTYEVSGLSGDIYIVAHADVYGF